MSLALHTIVYPQPPPTCNVLTLNQRQQLLRTTQKLAKVLGSAPQLIDCNYAQPFRLDCHDTTTAMKLRRWHTRNSSSSSSSSSASSSHSDSSDRVTFSAAAAAATLIPFTHIDSASPLLLSQFSERDRNKRKKKPPLLRLAAEDPSQVLPSSAHRDHQSWGANISPISPPSTASSIRSTSSTDHILIASSPRSYSLPVPRTRRTLSLLLQTEDKPDFVVKSEASFRRKKLERVRKRLGECVPVEALFPDEEIEEEEEEDDETTIAAADRGQNRYSQGCVKKDHHRSHFASRSKTLDAVYECPDEHGSDGLASGFADGISGLSVQVITRPNCFRKSFWKAIKVA